MKKEVKEIVKDREGETERRKTQTGTLDVEEPEEEGMRQVISKEPGEGPRQRLGGGERKTEIQKGVEKGRGGEQEREAGRGRREAEQQLTEKEENFLPT